MPLYKISILLTSGKQITGIKEHTSGMLEVVFHFFKNKVSSHYGTGNIKEFDCVMISKQSKSYKSWMESQRVKAGKGNLSEP